MSDENLSITGPYKAVVSLRSVKENAEVKEIEKAVDIAYEMHVTAMKMCREVFLNRRSLDG